MAKYPIIEQRSLTRAQRSGLWGIGPRSRSASELPLPNAHEAVVYKSGGRFVVDDGRSRLDDDHVRNATNISVVDMRVKAPIVAQLTIPAGGGAEFTVQVTFQCTVRRPEVVVEAGLHDLEALLTEYLQQHQPLQHVGENSDLSEVNEVRRDVNAAVRAYVMLRPPDCRGVDVEVGSVAVLTPEDYAAFEHERLEKRRAGQLTSEEQRQKHLLEQENEQLLHLRKTERQQFDQQMAAQAAVNQQALDEMQQRYEDMLARMRQTTANDIQFTQARFDQKLEAESVGHQQQMRSTAIDRAIDGAQRLGAAIDADKFELLGLLPTANGEISMAEARDQLIGERERKEAAEREDARQAKEWDQEGDRLKWRAERADADHEFGYRVAELQARVEVIKTGISRGMVDHESLDGVLSSLNGMVKQLQSAGVDKAEDEDELGARPASDMTVKGDVVSNAFEGSSSNPGPVDEPLREEEF